MHGRDWWWSSSLPVGLRSCDGGGSAAMSQADTENSRLSPKRPLCSPHLSSRSPVVEFGLSNAPSARARRPSSIVSYEQSFVVPLARHRGRFPWRYLRGRGRQHLLAAVVRQEARPRAALTAETGAGGLTPRDARSVFTKILAKKREPFVEAWGESVFRLERRLAGRLLQTVFEAVERPIERARQPVVAQWV